MKGYKNLKAYDSTN